MVMIDDDDVVSHEENDECFVIVRGAVLSEQNLIVFCVFGWESHK